jgi:hypothetical protein
MPAMAVRQNHLNHSVEEAGTPPDLPINVGSTVLPIVAIVIAFCEQRKGRNSMIGQSFPSQRIALTLGAAEPAEALAGCRERLADGICWKLGLNSLRGEIEGQRSNYNQPLMREVTR